MNRKTLDELQRLCDALIEEIDTTEPIFSTDTQEDFYYAARPAIPELIEGMKWLVEHYKWQKRIPGPEPNYEMMMEWVEFVHTCPEWLQEMLR